MKINILFLYCMISLFSYSNTTNNIPTIEIELKYEIVDMNTLHHFLQKLTYEKTQSTHDIYFDTTQGTYFKKGLWIRNRNNNSLDFKFNRNGLLNQNEPMTNYCEEHSFQLPLNIHDQERLSSLCDFLQLHVPENLNLQTFLTLNNLQEMAIVKKTRKIYRHQTFNIMIDTIENIGDFLEIEHMAFDATQVHNITNQMKELLNGLGLRHTTITYDAAWWKKHHPDIYVQGRYIRHSS